MTFSEHFVRPKIILVNTFFSPKIDFREPVNTFFRKNDGNLDRIHDLLEISFYDPNMMPDAFRSIADVFLVSWDVILCISNTNT